MIPTLLQHETGTLYIPLVAQRARGRYSVPVSCRSHVGKVGTQVAKKRSKCFYEENEELASHARGAKTSHDHRS
jgi:hypothetical protein